MAKKVFNIDANEDDANWVKQTWDLPFEPDSLEQAAWCRAQGITEEEFRKGPAYRLGAERRKDKMAAK